MPKASTTTAKSLGRRGGRKTLATHGRSHFVKMAEARWGKVRATKK